MYFAYGWPKLLRAIDDRPRDEIVHLSVGGSWLVVVSGTAIQVWTAGQHRVRLGELLLTDERVAEDGTNELALWGPSISTLAVLTSKDQLKFFDVVETDKKLLGVPEQQGQALRLVSIRFRSATAVPKLGDDASCTSLVADEDGILVGLSSGRLQVVSWRGQLRGSCDLWSEGGLNIGGPAYLAEANSIPSLPQSPLVSHAPPANLLSNGHVAGLGIAQLEYSAELRTLVAVLADGRVLTCSAAQRGLRSVADISAERWVGVTDAVCAAVGSQAEILAVGSRRGTVELFNLADNGAHLRTISLFDWGYSADDTGPVSCIQWTPDCKAFAVGWSARGLAVWTVSGCRLMCSIRQGSLSHVAPLSPSAPLAHTMFLRNSEPMFGGVAALAWAEHGYVLLAVESRTAERLVQFSFAKGCLTRAIAGSSQVWQIMQAEDRVLLIQSNEDDELQLQHLVIPHIYMAANWPVMHVAANDDGTYLAVAGKHGLILYNLRSRKWRVFGDVSQERQVSCVGLMWVGKIIVVCNRREASGQYELSLYPRYHLDESSLLQRVTLPARPIAMDSWQDYILVATMPFDIKVYHVHVDGDLSPIRTPPVQVRTVRELSIMSARKPPVDMRFVPTSGFELGWDQASASEPAEPSQGASSSSLLSPNGGGALSGVVVGGGKRDVAAEAVLRQPTRCMLLRTDGELSLLDLDRGSERALVSGVEHFWLTCGRPKEEAALIEEVPWWAYGHRGMQVWYPSSPADTSVSSADLHSLDPELDFDREVYPLGVSPAAGVIVGVSQRLSLSACADMPCFEPIPQAQPILPCLLRHLLQRNAIEDAVQLARLSASRPHFSHSLEWLLFTVFDAEMALNSARKKSLALKAKLPNSHSTPDLRQAQPPKPGLPTLLQRACDLIRHFPEFLDVVVSVARKTDSRHWAELFAAAGKSTQLFEECFEKKQYRTATCYILVVEKLEGPTIGQQNALRLLQTTLRVGGYELAGELVRFLLRSGREYTGSNGDVSSQEEKKANDGILKSFFGFGFTSAAPKVRADVLHATVKHILGDQALKLLQKKELRELVAFVKGTQFDFTEFLHTELARSARLEDFASALRTVKLKLGMDDLQSRLDAEFLLAHMRTVGFREWTVVLATLLRRKEVLLELFRGDTRLWNAYSRTLRAQPNSSSYEDLLVMLERELGLLSPGSSSALKPTLRKELVRTPEVLAPSGGLLTETT